MTYSMFIKHFAANRAYMARAMAEQIRREAIARLTERMNAGRADSILDFSDLIERIEAAVMPR